MFKINSFVHASRADTSDFSMLHTVLFRSTNTRQPSANFFTLHIKPVAVVACWIHELCLLPLSPGTHSVPNNTPVVIGHFLCVPMKVPCRIVLLTLNLLSADFFFGRLISPAVLCLFKPSTPESPFIPFTPEFLFKPSISDGHSVRSMALPLCQKETLFSFTLPGSCCANCQT